MTYGAPRDAADMPAYLARVRGGKEPGPELVREFVTRYERIGWSPLVERTQAQAAALEAVLGDDWRVAAGMRFSAPSVGDAVAALGPVDRIVGIVMSPQFSPLLMAGYGAALREAARPSGAPVSLVEAWHREPGFVDVLAGLVRDALREPGDRSDAAGGPGGRREEGGPGRWREEGEPGGRQGQSPRLVVFSAHSLPRRVFDAEPGYVAQLRETAELVAARLGLAPEGWRWAYQSAGHTQEEWLRPDLKELFPEIAASGAREVLVVPVQFLSDHLEVLFDLDIATAAEAETHGLRYRRIRMPNTDPRFIGALADVARGAVAERSAV